MGRYPDGDGEQVLGGGDPLRYDPATEGANRVLKRRGLIGGGKETEFVSGTVKRLIIVCGSYYRRAE